MAKQTKLDKIEFQKRAHEVFLFAEGEEPLGICQAAHLGGYRPIASGQP